MKTCLIFGGGGFIGSHLVRELTRLSQRNIVVVGRNSSPLFKLEKNVNYVKLNSLDLVALGRLLDNCDEIIDLAYSTVPKTSFDDPVFDVVSNLPFNVALLKMACERKLKKFLFVSSGGTVYGNANYLPIDESHPTNPISPYGITKLAIEKYGLMYHRLRDLPLVVIRPSNPYGPNQHGGLGQGFIATALHQVLAGRPIHIFGEKGTIRDYIYVKDLAVGIAAALDHGEPGAIYNIGSCQGLNNREILDSIERIVRRDGFSLNIKVEPLRPFDVAANVLSSARLSYASTWRSEVGFDEGLERTWSWIKSLT